MSERDYAPLSIACVRGLCDKLYDKRKFAGVEIEKMVKDFNEAKNTNQIKRLIRVLGQDLMSSTNPNVKNGALMGLSSVAVGLGKECVEYLPELTSPVLACFSESESRVRYQAAEALFNVLKIARGAALAQLPSVLDALARLAADPEPQVQHAAELLDRLLKDIVTESTSLDVSALVAMVRARMYSRHGCARQLVVSWVAVLDALPHLDLLRHLPGLLDGLFLMLDDPNPEIRRMCEVQLNEFLRSIKKDPSRVDFQAMVNILITHAQSSEELLQLTAVTWLKEFVSLAGSRLRRHASGALAATLPCLAYTDEPRKRIRETAVTVNFLLTKLIVPEPAEEFSQPVARGTGEGEDEKKDSREGQKEEELGEGGQGAEGQDAEDDTELDLEAVVSVLTQMLHHSSVHTKVAALDWILLLYNKLPAEMFAQTDAVFVSVVGSLADAADDVVRRALAVLAEICSCTPAPASTTPAAPTSAQPGDLEASPYYYKFLQSLLRLLANDNNLLEDRGAFIIRQLCVLLNAEEIYKALARALVAERELRFVSTAAALLAAILLTAAELHDLRLQLRHFHDNDPATLALFSALYSCWCHSPVWLLALCLLTHNYELCNRLITTFGDLEITVDFLTEIDKLVQLIESPIFAYMRLELLGGARSGALRAALFGVLMLLPQSDAFHTLRARLQCAPPPPPHPTREEAREGEELIDLDALVEEFRTVQAAHRKYRLRAAPSASATHLPQS